MTRESLWHFYISISRQPDIGKRETLVSMIGHTHIVGYIYKSYMGKPLPFYSVIGRRMPPCKSPKIRTQSVVAFPFSFIVDRWSVVHHTSRFLMAGGLYIVADVLIGRKLRTQEKTYRNKTWRSREK